MKTKRRLLSLLLCGAVLFSLCTPPAFFETQAAPDSGQAGDGISVLAGNEDVSYIDADGSQQSAAATVVDSNMTTWGEGWYVVKGNVTIGSRVTVGTGVHLILADGCELMASDGIGVGAGSSLTIYAQSTNERMGRLNATATSYGSAGIGGDSYGAGGNITIIGGRVVATGGSCGAGIGGGDHGAGGNITISGGNVDATGGGDGAGIGGGWGRGGGTITISGGTVNATGGDTGAGIGGGWAGAGGDITINGGTVTAIGKNGGAGIGGGIGLGGGDGAGGNITISGGTVDATGEYGAGIGGGSDSAGGNITISGGKVTATGKKGGAGIGGGYSRVDSGTFSTPNGNAVIFATDILGGSVTEDEKANWSGMIFEGDNGAVYGSDFTLSADAEIPAGKTLTIKAGQTLTIEAGVTFSNHGVISNNGTIDCYGTIAGDGSLPGNKAIQPAPAAPVVKNTTPNSVELEAVAANSNTGAAAEYSMDNGANWQDSPVFTGLNPNTEYTFVVRYKGVDPFFAASPPSNATKVTTGSEQYTVSVSAEPAEGGTASASLTSSKQGEEITLTATRNRGWHFKEWRVISGGVTIRDNKFIMPAGNVIVKAVFEKDSGSGSGGGNSSGSSSGSSGSSSSSSTTNYTLTFESNGGSAIEKVTETSGKIIDLSGYRPTREGYDFNGWYLDKELTRKITEIRLDGNKTVYAGWTEHKTNSGTGTISTPDSNRKSPPTGEYGAA